MSKEDNAKHRAVADERHRLADELVTEYQERCRSLHGPGSLRLPTRALLVGMVAAAIRDAEIRGRKGA